jgi:hypothetical protein
MFVFGYLRTGSMLDLSTTRFPVMATAVLPQQHPPPQITGEFVHLFVQWHRLLQVGQKSASRFFGHKPIPSKA